MDTNDARLKIHDSITDMLTDFADGDDEDREALAIVVDNIFDALDIRVEATQKMDGGEVRAQCSVKLPS